MKTQNKYLLVLIFSFFAATVFAESGTETTQTKVSEVEAKTPPKINLKISENYYNFEGTRQQSAGLYSFGDTTLKMELLSLTYQVNPSWTLLVLGTHLENFVVTKMAGQDYRDRTYGFGDTIVSAMSTVTAQGSFLLLGDAGVSLPTGSVRFKNPLSTSSNYAYNMQLGSGTYDGVLGLTPMWFFPKYQVGGHLSAILRSGVLNENGYHLGNQYKAEAWLDYPTSVGLTPRLVGYYKYRDAISGYDVTYEGNPQSPLRAYTDFYHHSQINWDVSAALKYKKTFSYGFDLEAEAGVPLAQDSQNSDGVVISTEYFGSVSVSGAF